MECHFHHPTTQVGTYRRRIGLFTLLVLSLLHTTGSYYRLGLLSEPLTILSGLCGLRYSWPFYPWTPQFRHRVKLLLQEPSVPRAISNLWLFISNGDWSWGRCVCIPLENEPQMKGEGQEQIIYSLITIHQRERGYLHSHSIPLRIRNPKIWFLGELWTSGPDRKLYRTGIREPFNLHFMSKAWLKDR